MLIYTEKEIKRLVKAGKLHMYKQEISDDLAIRCDTYDRGIHTVYFLYNPQSRYRSHISTTVKGAIERACKQGMWFPINVGANNVDSLSEFRPGVAIQIYIPK